MKKNRTIVEIAEASSFDEIDLQECVHELTDWLNEHHHSTMEIVIHILKGAPMRMKDLEEMSSELATHLIRAGYTAIPSRFHADWRWLPMRK